jgi:excinuclease ABC subunit A
MQFLPDLFVTCEACEGKRYNRETLQTRYRGLSIADALELSVDEARPLLAAIPKLRDPLAALARVGLGYLKLGQPATTLSGGEAQRVKLARQLGRRSVGRTLFILDEPTTGLHFAEIELLMASLFALRDSGNTVLIIEHDMDVAACCDWIIDLGPEGGDRGGRLIAQGPPAVVARCAESVTAPFLAARLDRSRNGKGRRSTNSGR